MFNLLLFLSSLITTSSQSEYQLSSIFPNEYNDNNFLYLLNSTNYNNCKSNCDPIMDCNGFVINFNDNTCAGLNNVSNYVTKPTNLDFYEKIFCSGNCEKFIFYKDSFDKRCFCHNSCLGANDCCFDYRKYCLPTPFPTASPTKKPTTSPTKNPTASPTKNPTDSPTKNPTVNPTKNPTASPVKDPTPSPTDKPTSTSNSKDKSKKLSEEDYIFIYTGSGLLFLIICIIFYIYFIKDKPTVRENQVGVIEINDIETEETENETSTSSFDCRDDSDDITTVKRFTGMNPIYSERDDNLDEIYSESRFNYN